MNRKYFYIRKYCVHALFLMRFAVVVYLFIKPRLLLLLIMISCHAFARNSTVIVYLN